MSSSPDRFVKGLNGSSPSGSTAVTNFPADYPDAAAEAHLLSIDTKMDDLALEATLDSGLGVYSRIEPGFVDVTGPTVIDTPAITGRFFVRRIWIKGAYNIPDGVGVQFTVRLGSTIVALDDLVASQPYADSIAKLGAIEAGGGEGELSIELSVARRVYYNIAVREV